MKKKITFRIKGSVQTDWSAFAHSSSFEDAKAGMKGVASKYFWRALVGALHQLESGFVVASPSSKIGKITLTKKQPSKIRLLNFGVDSGVGAGYEIMMNGKKPLEIDGNVVYRQKKPAEKSYDKNLVNLMKSVFGVDNIKPKDLHSFVKVLELTNKYTDHSVKQVALDRFLSILFCNEGGQCQVIEPDAKEDVKLKSGIYLKAVELLRLSEDKDLAKIIKAYVEKTHGLKERLRRHLAGNPDEFFDAIREDKEENKEEENQAPTDEPSKKEKSDKKPKDDNNKKLSKEEKEKLKKLEIEKKEIAEREKEVIKKLIELSIELDAASSDEEKAKIQKQMNILDKTADKKKEVKKDKEKEVKDKGEKPEKEPKEEKPEKDEDPEDEGK